MANYCTNCGKEIPDGVAFCTECGTPKEAAATPTPRQTQPRPEPASRPVYVHAAPVDARESVVGTGVFFGLNFLFGIPIIGWIACLLMAFVPKNKNIKHYARAMLIWLMIGAILLTVSFFALRGVVNLVKGYVTDFVEEYTAQTTPAAGNAQSGQSEQKTNSENTEGLGGILEIFGQLGDIGALLDQLGDLGDLEGLPLQ